jgi:hypothetical protein
MATITPRIPAARRAQTPHPLPLNILSSDPRPKLAFTDDGPGGLAHDGPRHDNDHHDFRNIEILPTPDETLAVQRPVFMPKKDLFHPHFLGNGPSRHLDTMFRQLRCDSTEMIRDVCYSAAQIAFLDANPDQLEKVRQETRAGNRYFLYQNVKVEELLAHSHKSMLVRASYDCPPFMRGPKMYDAGRFKQGMLVAILELERTTGELSIHYFEVEQAQTTFSMDALGGGGTRAALTLSFPPTRNHDDVHQMIRLAVGAKIGSEMYLVEFPKVLFAGFYNCLRCLQSMKETDFAFADYLAPNTKTPKVAFLAAQLTKLMGEFPKLQSRPPEYARGSDFKFNLSKILPNKCRISSVSMDDLCQPQALDIIRRETTLDEGQAVAFRDSLVRDLACTQGPPGCGKTFLGVKLAQVLIDSRVRDKPILVVCLTNHALDSFLTDLRDAGIPDLVRIGSSSKAEWTDRVNLRNLRRSTRFTKDEAQYLFECSTRKKELLAELELSCKGKPLVSESRSCH